MHSCLPRVGLCVPMCVTVHRVCGFTCKGFHWCSLFVPAAIQRNFPPGEPFKISGRSIKNLVRLRTHRWSLLMTVCIWRDCKIACTVKVLARIHIFCDFSQLKGDRPVVSNNRARRALLSWKTKATVILLQVAEAFSLRGQATGFKRKAKYDYICPLSSHQKRTYLNELLVMTVWMYNFALWLGGSHIEQKLLQVLNFTHILIARIVSRWDMETVTCPGAV